MKKLLLLVLLSISMQVADEHEFVVPFNLYGFSPEGERIIRSELEHLARCDQELYFYVRYYVAGARSSIRNVNGRTIEIYEPHLFANPYGIPQDIFVIDLLVHEASHNAGAKLEEDANQFHQRIVENCSTASAASAH